MSSITHQIDQPTRRESGGSKAQESFVAWALTAILGLALGLRIWGIGFGLPYDLSIDEIHEVIRALKLGAGEYSWTFGKGGLYYILFVEYGVLYVMWWLLGWVGSPREFAVLFIRDPSAFYLAGRLTVAFMGVLTCLVVFLLGRRIYDWRAGLAAALVGATAYMHGVFSHMINVDIGMTLALWASIFAYVKYEEQRDRHWLIGAGVLAGIAIAFKLPGAIVLLPLLLAIGSYPTGSQYPRQTLKHAGILAFATLITLTVMAPEWTTSITSLHENFSQFVGKPADASAPSEIDEEADLFESIYALNRYLPRERTGYVKILLNDYNAALVFTALLGAGIGFWRRQRWDIIWAVLIAVFLGIMTAADRSAREHYLLPIMPALWLLSSRALIAVYDRHKWVAMAGLACVVVPPTFALARQNYEWTSPDTRVIAKEWIEANVPSGAKILMDGTGRYRFVSSPPLTPNKSVVDRQVSEIAREGGRVSRGVSEWALELYADAIKQVNRPTYELYSTVYGLRVEDPTYYVTDCFDYIITSSSITRKYHSEIIRDRFPASASFYEQLNTDSRFQRVYSVGPIPWDRSGPTITVYRVLHACETPLYRHSPS